MLANRASSTTATLQLAFEAASRRAWLMLALFSFVVLVCTAMWHYHDSTVQEQDCPICSVVLHKVAELPTLHAPALMLAVVAYMILFVPNAPSVISAPALVLPPSCGPPQTL